MLIDFFYTLRSAKLPVSVKEYLTLLEALQADVVGPNSDDAFSLDDFYYLMGQKRLVNLSLWATGRAHRDRAPSVDARVPLAPARPIGGPAPDRPPAR